MPARWRSWRSARRCWCYRIKDQPAGLLGLAYGLPRGGFDVNLQLLMKLLGTSLATGLERVRLSQALARIEERNALAELAANDGLWDFDVEGNDVYFSPRWRAMLGYDEADLKGGFDWRSLVHPDDIVARAVGDPRARGRQDADLREHASHAPPQRRMALGHQPRQGAARCARPAAAPGRRRTRHHRAQAVRGGAVSREGERPDHAAVDRRWRDYHRCRLDHRLHQPGGRAAHRLAPGGCDGPAGRGDLPRLPRGDLRAAGESADGVDPARPRRSSRCGRCC